jgi:hypothetical protein
MGRGSSIWRYFIFWWWCAHTHTSRSIHSLVETADIIINKPGRTPGISCPIKWHLFFPPQFAQSTIPQFGRHGITSSMLNFDIFFPAGKLCPFIDSTMAFISPGSGRQHTLGGTDIDLLYFLYYIHFPGWNNNKVYNLAMKLDFPFSFYF